MVRDKLIGHKHYLCKHADDMAATRDWRWGRQEEPVGARVSDTAGDNV